MNQRFAMAAGGIAVVFLVTMGIAFQLMPGPLKSTDYLVIGAIATFVSMLVLFVILTQTVGKKGQVFTKEKPPKAED
jgi:quinol-cytochrome oxidoreductase complex cytochrome b subunit